MAVRSLNKVMLIAYVGDEPVIRNTTNSKVANLSVVTNDSRPNEQGGYEEIAEWHRIVAWGRHADIVEKYIHKGSRLYIEGRIRTRSYMDKSNVKRYITEIVADSIIMLDSRRDGAAPQGGGDYNSGNSWDNPQDNWGGNRNDASGWGSSNPSTPSFFSQQAPNNFNGGYQSSNFASYQGGNPQEPQATMFNGGTDNNAPQFNNAQEPKMPNFNGMNSMNNGMNNMNAMPSAPQNLGVNSSAPSSVSDEDDVPF